jgi:hypothetical protein
VRGTSADERRVARQARSRPLVDALRIFWPAGWGRRSRVAWRGTAPAAGWGLARPARELLAHRLDHHFHWRGTTSSVSVTSSPSFDSFFDPQQGQLSGAGITMRSRGRWSGNGLHDGRLRWNDYTVCVRAAPSRPPAPPPSPSPPTPRAEAPSAPIAAPCAPSGCLKAADAASRSQACNR